MVLRLRQIALVARTLEPVERALTAALGAAVCYRDPGVAKYGLHNALWALGGTFLEVVAPQKEGTAAGRYLDRRKGDGGYMFILDCDDLEARRALFAANQVRLVEDLSAGDDTLHGEALHLHPRDTGGCLLSFDRHGPDTSLLGSYIWAGRDWRKKWRADVRIVGATMQCDDPLTTANRWSVLMQRPVGARDGHFDIPLDNGFARFTAIEDDRGEGLAAVTLAAPDPAAVRAAARKAGCGTGDGWFDAGGVRFDLVPG